MTLPSWKPAACLFLGASLATVTAPARAVEVELRNCVENYAAPGTSQAQGSVATVGVSEDFGNLTVMELEGNYDRALSGPRELVAQRFYEDHRDNIDFVVVFTTFEFETGSAHAFYTPIRNDTSGIGQPLFDGSALFGSAGRLHGYVDMASLGRNSLVAQEPRFQFTLQTLAHEIMHRWGAHLTFRDSANSTSSDLLGLDQSHWSYFLDSDASIMYGNDWTLRPDGTFQSTAIRSRFSALDLYAAGLLSASEVPTLQLIRGGSGDASDLPLLGATSGGQVEAIGIDQVIAASGPREPAAAQAQKDFRAAFVLLKRPGEAVDAGRLLAIEQFRVRMQQYFSQITDGRGTLRIYPERTGESTTGLPQILTGSGSTPSPPGIASAVAWLEERQLGDGRWQDHSSTALRDTIAAVQALQELHPEFNGLTAARNWIAQQSPANVDQRSRRWLLDPVEQDLEVLTQARDPSGGWAIAPGWQSSPLDTVLVTEALLAHEASVPLRPQALYQLTSAQRSDGSFPIVSGGRGRVALTSRAAAALTHAEGDVYSDEHALAVSWLDARLGEDSGAADGLFPLPELIELYARTGRIDLAGGGSETIRQRVRSSQQVAGDWAGSVYLTATAALARARDQRGNLAIVGLPSAMPSAPMDGQRVQLTSTIANTGNAPVPASVARWFLGDPDQGGVQIGADLVVPALSANARTTLSADWDSTGHAGTAQLWLVLDATELLQETSESDNRVVVALTVLPPSALPDLMLDSSQIQFDPGSITILPSTVRMQASVGNLGLQAASNALVRLSQLRGSQRTTLAEARLDVPASGAAPIEIVFSATMAETMQLVLEVDPDLEIAEGSEDNNTVTTTLSYGPSLDLEVTAADIGIEPGSPTIVGRDVRLTARIHNRGTVDSPAARLVVDVVQGGTRYPIADTTVQITAGQSVVRTLIWRAAAAGNAQVQVVIDGPNLLAESREDNNAAQFDFVVSDATQSDLIIVADSVAFIPAPALQGQPLATTLRVRNLGADISQPFSVAMYASDPRLGGTRLVSATVPAGLAAGAEVSVFLELADWPLVGDSILHLVVDADAAISESDEENNRVVKPLRTLALPDLAVSLAGITLAPTLPVDGEPVQARVVVRNLGSQAAGSFTVKLFEGEASTGSLVPAEQSVPGLPAGGSVELTWTWTLGIAAQARQITVVVDQSDVVREGSESNNTAMLPFDVQDSNFFASERYISPNGDGIKDATAVVIRVEQSMPVQMRVLNGAQTVVRDFGAITLDEALRAQVVWDGRDDRARIVPDGDYRVIAVGSSQQILGSAAVTIDNNRSSILEAIETPYALYSEIPNFLQSTIPPSTSAYRHYLFGIASVPPGPSGRNGLYRSSTLFPEFEPIVSAAWLEGFRAANNYARVDVHAFSMNPDGRSIAFLVSASWSSGNPVVSLYTIGVDQTDSPALLISDAPIRADVLVHLNAHEVLVRSAGGSLQPQIIDLVDGSVRPYRDISENGWNIEAVGEGILVSSPGLNELTFYPRDAARPAITVVPSHDESAEAYDHQLSPDKRSVVVHSRSDTREAIEYVDFSSGVRSVLREAPSVVVSSPDPLLNPVRVDLYDFGWLEREGVLVVVDGNERRLETFGLEGQHVRSTSLGPLDRIGAYADRPGATFLRTVQAPRSTHLGAGCLINAPGDESDGERRAYDPTTGRLYLNLGEKIVYLNTIVETYLDWREGILDYRSADMRDGTELSEFASTVSPLVSPADRARFPEVSPCPDDRPADWPELILGDGARVRTDGHVQTLSHGVSAAPWDDAANITAIWPDESRFLLGSRAVSTLHNGTAVLQAQTRGRGIELSGVATDRNFAYYELEWAPIEQPGDWHVLTAASTEQVFVDEFLTWVPPQPGTFKIRLRVVDRAGNVTLASTTTSSTSSSPIDGLGFAPRYISPNGDGVQDEVVVGYRVRVPTTLDFRIENEAGLLVRSVDLTYGATDLGAREFRWDGHDDGGTIVSEGRYRIRVAGFSAWVVIDTTAPELGGTFQQAYQPFCFFTGQVENCDVDIAPALEYAADDAYPLSLFLEGSSLGTPHWETVSEPRFMRVSTRPFDTLPVTDERTWTHEGLSLDQVVGRRLRLVAKDRAGNAALLDLGDVEQGLWLQVVYDPPTVFPTGKSMSFQPPPFTNPLDTTRLTPLSVERVSDIDRLIAANGVEGLDGIAVETAPVDLPDQWTQRGSYPLDDVSGPGTIVVREAGQRTVNLPLETGALALGSRYLIRLRGDRTNGASVYSNVGFIAVGGIDPPLVVEGDIGCLASVREYYDGPLATANLISTDVNAGVPRIEAVRFDDDFAYFDATPYGITGFVEAWDAEGRRHVSAGAPLGCSHPTDPPQGFLPELKPFPVVSDQCDGVPSHRIGLGFVDAKGQPIRRLRLSYRNGITLNWEIAFDQVAQAGSAVVDTTDWPVGRYDAKLETVSGDGFVEIAGSYFTVETVPPIAELIEPAAGQRMCALPNGELDWQSLPAVFNAQTAAWLSHRLEIGAGATPLSWNCANTEGAEVAPCLPYKLKPEELSLVNKREVLIGKLQTFNGAATIRIKAMNWSGGTVCSASTIELDSAVEFSERAIPTRRLPGAPLGAVGISTAGTPEFSHGTFFMRADEQVGVRTTVHRARIHPESGELELVDPPLATINEISDVTGDINVQWDGRLGGNAVADGMYGVRIEARDECNLSRAIQYAVFVDSTPPEVHITSPETAASIVGGTVEVLGTATDTAFASWSMHAMSSATSGTWSELASGATPFPLPELLVQWQRGEATGPAQLRLTARDLLGNTSETIVPVQLSTPSTLIGSASTRPLLFSPNADGVLDIAQVEVGMLRVATVTIDVSDVVLFDGSAPASLLRYEWNGRNAANAQLADGNYPVRIHATDPNGIAEPETVTLSLTIDNSLPAIEVIQPSGAHARANEAARVRFLDAHLVDYRASLTRVADGVVVLSAQGTQPGDVLLGALNDLEEGEYRLVAEARDSAGNRSELEHRFTLDKTAPAVSLVVPLDGAIVAANAAAPVRGSVADERLALYTVSLASETVDDWEELASGTTNVEDAELMSWRPDRPDGRYRLRLRATDQAGNSSDAIHFVVVDGTPPIAQITQPAEGALVGGLVVVDGTATDANLAEYRLSVAPVSDPGHWSDIHVGTTPVDDAELASVTLALVDGEYLLRLVVRDAAGLSSSDQVRVRLRTSPPPAPLALIGHVVDNRDAVLEWQPVEVVELAGYHVYRGDVRITVTPVPGARYVDTLVPEGNAEYHIRSVDLVGNLSVPSNSVSLDFDRTAPLVQLIRPVQDERVSATVPIVGTAYSRNDFREYRLSAQLIEPAGAAIELRRSPLAIEAQLIFDWSTTGFAEDARVRLRLDAEDQSGNIESQSIEVVVDNTAPAAPTGLAAVMNVGDAQIAWNPNSEADLLGYLLYRDGRLVNVTGAPPADLRAVALTDANWVDRSVPNGQHTYVVHAIDRAGNISASSEPAVLEPVLRPPHLTIVSPADDTAFEESIVVLATSADLDIAEVRFSYRLDGASAWVDLEPALIEPPYRMTWTPSALPYGRYEIRALARDSNNQVDPDPPIVRVRYADLTAPSAVTALTARADGNSVLLSWSASPATDLAEYLIERDVGFWVTVATVAAGETTYLDQDLPDGSQRYRIRAVDVENNASPGALASAYVFGIEFEHPYTPTQAAVADVVGTSAMPGELSVHIVNAQGASDLPPTATTSEGGISLSSVPLTIGSNAWTLRVTDAQGNRSRRAEIRIDRGDRPAPPAGLQATVDDHDVELSWTANAEPNVIGYRVLRNGQAQPADSSLGLPVDAIANAGSGAEATVDADPVTYWELAPSDFDNPNGTAPPELELAWSEPRIITAVNLTWTDDAHASGNLDLYAWSGFAWVRVADARGAATSSASLALAQPYRSDRLKLVVRGNAQDGSSTTLRLAELEIIERPLQATTSRTDTLIDGNYRYRVTAVDEFAFASEPSLEVSVDVGDATGPEGVLLTGAVAGADAHLAWTASTSPDVAHYVLSRDGIVVATIAAAEPRTYIDVALANGEHRYVIRGFDGFGNGGAPSNEVVLSVAEQGPGVPQNVRISAPAVGNALDISWEAGNGAPAVGYVVRSALAVGGPYSIIARPATTFVRDTLLTNDVTYFYTVAAVDIAGNQSAESAPVSGTPRDRSAPAQPHLGYPTIAEMPVSMLATATRVCGNAEAGATVILENSGIASGSMLSRDQTRVDRAPALGYLGDLTAAPDGIHALLGDIGSVRVVSMDTMTTVASLGGSTRLEQWTAHGAALYYATTDDRIVRQELGFAAVDVPIEVSMLHFFAVSADESLVVLGGTYAANGDPAESGIWVVGPGPDEGARIGDLQPEDFEQEPPALSADGRHALLRSANGELVLVDLVTHTEAARLPFNSQARASWSSDARRFVYEIANPDGSDELWIYDVDTAQAVPALQMAGTVDAVAWSPFANEIAVAMDGRIDVIALADGQSRLLAPLAASDQRRLQWTASGRLVASGSQSLQRVELAGQFCFASAPLHPGTNVISAAARDAAGNLGFASPGIIVQTPADAIPDLAITASDILFVPAGGQPGVGYSAIVAVRNAGSAVAERPTVSARLIGPDGQVRLIAPAEPLPDIAAGASASVTLPFGVLAQSGRHRLNVVLDPTAQIRELNEDNNVATRDLVLASDARPELAVTVARTLFAPGERVIGEVRVSNPGDPFDGRIAVTIIDQVGETVADLGNVAINDLPFGGIVNHPIEWNSDGIQAGHYRLSAQLLDLSSVEVGRGTAAFEIGANRNVVLSVSSDPSQVTVGGTVGVTAMVDFVSGNSALQNVRLRFSATAQDGSEVWQAERLLGTLQAGYVLQLTEDWSTADVAQGVYTLSLQLISAELQGQAQTTVTVVAPTAMPVLSGTIDVTPGATVIAGQPASARYRITNTGSQPATAMQARLRLFASPGQAPIAQREDTFDLSVGAQSEAELPLLSPPLALTAHVLVLEARLANDVTGEWRLLAQRSVPIVDGMPPVIEVIDPVSTAVHPAVVPFRARISDLHSAVQQAQVRADGGAWQPLQLAVDGTYRRALFGLVDGPHQLQVRALDRWGNEAVSSAVTFEVDASPPVIQIEGVADGDVVSGAVTPLVAVTDTNLGITDLRLDGQVFVSGTLVDAEGYHVLSVRAADQAGNVSMRSVRFTIDTLAPSVSITEPTDGTVTAQDAVDVLVSSEAGARIEVRTGVFTAEQTAAADGTARFIAVPLQPGDNVIEATALDLAGNLSAPATTHVRVESGSGTALIGTMQPADTTLAHGSPLIIAVRFENPGLVALPQQALRLRVLESPTNVLETWSLTRPFAAQEVHLEEVAFDTGSWPLATLSLRLEVERAGVWESLDIRSVALVDRTAPMVSAVSPLPAAILRGPVVVQAHATDALTPPVRVDVRIDQDDWIALVADPDLIGVFRSAALALPDGEHSIGLRARDGADNECVRPASTFEIDSIAPLINIGGVADGALLATPVSPTIAIADAHLRTTTIRLDGQDFVSGTLIDASGVYILEVSADDHAGNSSVATVQFTLDLDAPSIIYTAPEPGAVLDVPTVDVSGRTEPFASVRLTNATFVIELLADAEGDFVGTAVPLEPGENSVSAFATDLAGNAGPVAILLVNYEPSELLLEGTLDVPANVPLGSNLAFAYALFNRGLAALAGVPIRIEMAPAGSSTLIDLHEFVVDLPPGGSVQGILSFATADLPMGDYHIVVRAFYADEHGQPKWITLAARPTRVIPAVCRGYAPPDRFFADGFDGEADGIFCDGFEWFESIASLLPPVVMRDAMSVIASAVPPALRVLAFAVDDAVEAGALRAQIALAAREQSALDPLDARRNQKRPPYVEFRPLASLMDGRRETRMH